MSEFFATQTIDQAGVATRRSWLVAFSIVMGPIGALLTASVSRGLHAASSSSAAVICGFLMSLVIAPVLEELAFREFLQGILSATRLGNLRIWEITGANLATSLIFAACHVPSHGAGSACLIVFPSLMLGRLKEHFASIVLVIGLHIWYNASLFIVSKWISG